MTPAQITILRADILAKQAIGQPLFNLDEQGISNYYNAASLVNVWRTQVTRAEVYHQTSGEGTNWDWNTYKAQAVTEQNAWVQMFMGDIGNMALPNLRSGVEKIFGLNNAQTLHVKAIGKRLANRVEAMFAVGSGSLVSPSVMAFEGTLAAQFIADVLAGIA